MINFIQIPIENAQNMWYSLIKSQIDEGGGWRDYQKVSIKNSNNCSYREDSYIDVEYEVIVS
jgi:hypothetical protein